MITSYGSRSANNCLCYGKQTHDRTHTYRNPIALIIIINAKRRSHHTPNIKNKNKNPFIQNGIENERKIKFYLRLIWYWITNWSLTWWWLLLFLLLFSWIGRSVRCAVVHCFVLYMHLWRLKNTFNAFVGKFFFTSFCWSLDCCFIFSNSNYIRVLCVCVCAVNIIPNTRRLGPMIGLDVILVLCAQTNKTNQWTKK